MGTFNTYGRKSRKYGDANPVWLTVSQKERSGGTFDPIPPVGTIIPAGTLVHLEGAGGKAYIVKTFRIVGVQGNILRLQSRPCDFKPEKGMNFCVTPEDPTGVLSAFSLEQTVKITFDDKLKIYAIDLGTPVHTFLKEGMILTVCDRKGDHFFIPYLPTGLTENDVWIDEGDEYATCASVFHGEVMEDRIQPIPQAIKNVLPQIKFVKGI